MTGTDLKTDAARLLERAAKRSEAAEVYAVETDRTTVEFRSGELFALETSTISDVGLRVMVAGHVGFAASSSAETGASHRPGARKRPAGFDLVDAAVGAAALGPLARFGFPGSVTSARVNAYDNRVLMLPAKRIAEWGQDLLDAVRARTTQLKLDLVFRRDYHEVTLKNTAGLEGEFTRAEFDLTATGLLVKDGLAWLTEYENLSDGRTLNIGALADRLEQRALSSQRRAAFGAGRRPVIVMPPALPALLEPLLLGASGRHLATGTSPLVGRVEQMMIDSQLTLADNPLRGFGLASSPFDGEGVAGRRNVLFERGVFMAGMFDLTTAALAGTASTGSARRRRGRPPHPGRANLELEPGKAKLSEAIAGIKEGLIVHEVIGERQSNLLSGEVSLCVASGNKIESGTVTGRVKGVCLSGNVYDMLREVEAVGDTQQDLGDAFLPFVVFPGLAVAPGN